MKKILFSLVAMAMMLVSCQNEAWNICGFDKGVDVVLKVTSPSMEVTRAEASGLDSGVGAIDNFDNNAHLWDKYDLRYILEVYAVTEEKNDFVVSEEPIYRDVFTTPSYSANGLDLELRLVPNRYYKFVVWADFVDEGTKSDLYYNTASLRQISRTEKFKHVAMDEAADAYYISHRELIKNSGDLKLELTRPFAKLRVVAIDHHEISRYSTLERVEVKFDTKKNPVSEIFNAVDNPLVDSPENNCDAHNYVCDVNPVPYVEYSGTTDEGEAVKGFVLFSDYILAPRSGEQPVSFTMDIYDQKGKVRTVDFDTQIPTCRNHLTTVVGYCLTSKHTTIVSINDTLLSGDDFILDADEVSNK